MRFYLISDNEDTLVGMRLAGIDGVLVSTPEEAEYEIKQAMQNVNQTAVVLIAQKVVDMCPEFVYELKLKQKRPLIVEIPDREGNGRLKESITRYVREAVGIKL